MTIAVERISATKSPIWLRYSHQARFGFVSAYVEDKVVLDLACGEGASSELFLKAGASRVLAGDFSTETLVQTRLRLAGISLEYINCDAILIPLPDNSLDVYASLETIEHLRDDRRYLAEATRLVRRDGCFICSTPNRALTNPGKELHDKPWNPFHVREYTLAEFIQLLEDYWMEVEVYGQYPHPAWWVRFVSLAGKHLPGYPALHILQLLKLFRLIHDSPSRYQYKPISDRSKYYENILVVCRKPKLIHAVRRPPADLSVSIAG